MMHHYLLIDQFIHLQFCLATTIIFLCELFLGCFAVIFGVCDMFVVFSVGHMALCSVFLYCRFIWAIALEITKTSICKTLNSRYKTRFLGFYFILYIHLNCPIPRVQDVCCWTQVHQMLHCYMVSYSAGMHGVMGAVWVSGACQYPETIISC